MANCIKIAGGIVTLLLNGAVLRRASGDGTLHLNKVQRTVVEGGGGFVTEEPMSPGGEFQMTDTNEIRLSDIHQFCNGTVTVLEPSGKIYIFTGATYIDALDKNVRAGTWPFHFTAEDYTEQLPQAGSNIGLAA